MRTAPTKKRTRAVDAAIRAREAQARLAEMRRNDPMSVPKMALSIMNALHVLLPGYGRETDKIALSQLMDLSGERNERDVYRTIGWLRDNFIIERPKTKGGAHVGAPTRFLTDAEVAALYRMLAAHHARFNQIVE